MANIDAWLESILTKDENGNIVNTRIKADAVYASDKTTTVQTHMDDTDKHLSSNEKTLLGSAGQAGGLAVLGDDGKIPAAQLPSATMRTDFSKDTYAEMEAITGMQSGDTCFVNDASADTTVDAGWAIYRYNGTSWQKVAEQESLDVVAGAGSWDDLVGKPTSSASDIDTAVASSKLLKTKLVTEIPATWPTDVAADGVLYVVDSLPSA